MYTKISQKLQLGFVALAKWKTMGYNKHKFRDDFN